MRSPNPRTAIANNLKTTRPTHETPFNDHCRAGIRTGACGAGLSPEELAKRAKRKNLTVKEWNTDSQKKTRWLDHLTVYD